MRRQFAVLVLLILTLASVTQSSATPIEVLRDGASGRVFGLRVTPDPMPSGASMTAPMPDQLRATADQFILANLELIGITDPGRDLVATPATTDNLGFSRIKYFQKHQGLDVFGGEIYVHLNRAGQVTYVKTKTVGGLPASVTSLISERDAQESALRLAGEQSSAAGKVLASRLLILPLGMIRSEVAEKTHLAWEVQVADEVTGGETFLMTYYLDAQTGDNLLELSGHEYLNRRIYDCAGGTTGNVCQLDTQDPFYPNYYHGRTEGMPARGPFPNPAFPQYGSNDVDSLYVWLGMLQDYHSTTFGINGSNGHGGLAVWPLATPIPLDESRGVTHPETGGAGGGSEANCPNNAWHNNSTGSLYFCRGMVKPDFAGHEFSHSIVFHSFHDGNGFPIGNPYSYQQGTLNEGYADYMGEVFEAHLTGSTDWLCPGGLIYARGLSDPHSTIRTTDGLPNPDRFHDSSFYCGTQDNGGVHMNSTVVSHAFYLISEGGEHNGCDIVPQGIDVAQRIFFRGWRTYFSRTAGFNEAYTDLIQACNDLYPGEVCAEVTKALQAVELNQPGRCSGIGEVAPPCAANHSGTAITTRNNGYPIVAFPVGDEIWLSLSAATANRTLDFLLLPHVASRPIWQATTALAIDTANGTVQADSTLFTLFGVAMTEGSYDVMIDGNRDGFYQPWADTILPITITPATSGVGDGARPTVTGLRAIQPNPTREGANVAFSLAQATVVMLRVYDVAGRLVRTVASETLPAGMYVRAWDGRDDNGRLTNAGLYFVKFIAGATVDSRKLVRTQ